MPEFEVIYKQIEIYTVTVEAESEDNACEIVSNMVEDGSIKEHHWDSDGDFTVYEV